MDHIWGHLHSESCRLATVLFNFQPVCAPTRPLRIVFHPQVGQKRGREQLEELQADYAEGGRRKKVRLGFPASQWITVYNKHQPMKQR